MELNIQLPTDTVERRRVQNRIAQRKFRRKATRYKCLTADSNSLPQKRGDRVR
jgi:hypothetical protein